MLASLISSIVSSNSTTTAASQVTNLADCISPSTFRTPRTPFWRNHPSVRLEYGWVVTTTTIECMLEPSVAATVLQSFYRNIIFFACTTSNPEQRYYRLRLGPLTLEFECRQCEVTWFFVRQFAQMMLESTQRGFIGAYQLFYDHRRGNMRIMIALYIDI